MFEWILKILRPMRAKWHGDFYDECKRRDDLFLRLLNEQSAALMNTMAEWHKASLCNQISLANKRPGGRTLYTPWALKKSFALAMLESGHLGFYYTGKKQAAIQGGIIINSMPKSGTHFVAAVLEALGFLTVSPFGAAMRYDDANEVIPGLLYTPTASVDLPFEVQAGLIQPDHYMYAHVEQYEAVANACRHGLDKMLVPVRDFRYATVSAMRHFLKNTVEYQPLSVYTSEDLYQYLQNNSDIIFAITRACVRCQRDGLGYVVRFEQLISHDKEKMLPSLKAISQVTGCSVEAVFKAVEEKNGASTITLTGNHVTLDKIWTKEVEDLFIAKGGDILNEQLGYSRHYAGVL